MFKQKKETQFYFIIFNLNFPEWRFNYFNYCYLGYIFRFTKVLYKLPDLGGFSAQILLSCVSSTSTG